MDHSIPVVRLTIEGMKHELALALSGYALKLDEQIQKAIEAYCTPENLERVIQGHAQQAIDAIVREEVDRFYRIGEGRQVVRELVNERLGHVLHRRGGVTPA